MVAIARATDQDEGDFWGEPISVYTRAQAIEDGYIIDVSEIAQEASFRWPVGVTRTVWAMIEAIPPRFRGIQDVQGRLWDVLWMASRAARRGGTEPILYRVIMHHGRQTYVTLKLVLSGEAPDGGPCLTIMLPTED